MAANIIPWLIGGGLLAYCMSGKKKPAAKSGALSEELMDVVEAFVLGLPPSVTLAGSPTEVTYIMDDPMGASIGHPAVKVRMKHDEAQDVIVKAVAKRVGAKYGMLTVKQTLTDDGCYITFVSQEDANAGEVGAWFPGGTTERLGIRDPGAAGVGAFWDPADVREANKERRKVDAMLRKHRNALRALAQLEDAEEELENEGVDLDEVYHTFDLVYLGIRGEE